MQLQCPYLAFSLAMCTLSRQTHKGLWHAGSAARHVGDQSISINQCTFGVFRSHQRSQQTMPIKFLRMLSNKRCCNHVLFCMTACIVKGLTAVCSYPLDKSETKEWPYPGCALEFTSAQTPHMVISHSLTLTCICPNSFCAHTCICICSEFFISAKS